METKDANPKQKRILISTHVMYFSIFRLLNEDFFRLIDVELLQYISTLFSGISGNRLKNTYSYYRPLLKIEK